MRRIAALLSVLSVVVATAAGCAGVPSSSAPQAIGTVEVAAMAHSHLIVVGAARDAARLGSRGGTDGEMQTLVTAETGDLSGGVPTSCNAGTAAGMCITRAASPGPSSVKMQVCYSHALVVGFPGLLSNPKLLCSATVMRVLT